MDTNTILKQIENAEKTIENSKVLLSKAEGRLEMLEQQRTQVVNEILQLGLKPEDLSMTISNLENEIQKDLEEIQKNIPDFLNN